MGTPEGVQVMVSIELTGLNFSYFSDGDQLRIKYIIHSITYIPYSSSLMIRIRHYKKRNENNANWVTNYRMLLYTHHIIPTFLCFGPHKH